MIFGLICLGVACLIALAYSGARWRHGRYHQWVNIDRHGCTAVGLMVRYGNFDFATLRGLLVFVGLGVVELWAGFAVEKMARSRRPVQGGSDA